MDQFDAGDAACWCFRPIARIDHVVLDKTGTLTLGRPELIGTREVATLAAAAALAATSRHPLAQALVRAAGDVVPATDVVEHPGRDRRAARVAWARPRSAPSRLRARTV